MINCICINADGKPNDVPNSQWIIKGTPYTIIDVQIMNLQKRILGVELAEITIDSPPYHFYRADRFIFDLKDMPALIEMINSRLPTSKEIAKEFLEQLQIKEEV